MNDADDPFDELWVLFGAEYEEYLAVIETILSGPDAAPRIDELFRAFHSLKGGSAALSLRSVEKVAHAAEDVLHKVRAGSLALTPPVEQALFATIDELRHLETAALRARADQPVNSALVERLKALLTTDGGVAPPPKPAPPDVKASAAPVETPLSGSLVPARGGGDGSNLPDLTILQDPILTLAGSLEEDLAPAAAMLALTAEDLGLHGLAAAARQLAVAFDLSDPLGRRALLGLCDRLSALERGTGEPIGAGAVIGAAERWMAELLQEFAADLKSQPDDPGAWRAAIRLLSVLDMVELAEIADLAVPFLADKPDLSGEIIDLMALAGIFLETGAGTPRDEIATLRTSVFRALDLPIDVAHDPATEGPPAAAAAVDDLSTESRVARAAAQAAGQVELLVVADLESDPAVGEAVVEALRGHTLITSRSRLDLGDGVFEFQVATAGPVDAFVDSLRDSDGALVSLRRVSRMDDPDMDLLGARPSAQGTTASPPPPVQPAGTAAAPSPIAHAETAATAQAAPAPKAAPKGAAPSDGVVRVPSGAIDTIMDRIGDLRLGATGLAIATDRYEAARVRSILDGLIERSDSVARDELRRVSETLSDLERSLDDAMAKIDGGVRRLYQSTTALRVVSIGTLFTRLLRPVRETAGAVGKDVSLQTEGDDVQVDKATVEMLVDPLTHIVRNAIDHGIETADVRAARGKPPGGTIVVRARQGTQTATIEVQDDGGGIDFERVRDKAVEKQLITAAAAAALTPQDALELIFLPGFSTRDQVSETSGRGVGMDIVATVVRKKLGGTLRIDSRKGEGTRLTIEFPISAAIQRVLSVRAGHQVVALLERAVAEIVRVPSDRMQAVGGRLGTFLRGTFLPIVDLAAAVGWTPAIRADGEEVTVVVVDDGRRRIGFAVDALAGRQEVYFKRMHPLLERNRLLGGIAVIGSGAPLFALDAEGLIDRAQALAQAAVNPALADSGHSAPRTTP